MRILITGGTGYLGRAVTRELSRAGHEVIGLVRTEEKAELLRRLGATPLPGDIADASRLASAAADSDAVVHLAQATGPERASVDRSAVEALLRASREGKGTRFLLYTSVLFVLGDTGDAPAEESTAANPPSYGAARADVERVVLSREGDGLRCAVARPGMVYGGGEGGSVSELFRGAFEEGAPTYVGGGTNRWSLVHREDVAALYRLIIERRSGGIFHAVDGHPLSVLEVAREVSRAAGAGGAVRSMPLEEARRYLGSFADALCLDQVAGAARARSLGWEPSRLSFKVAAAKAFEEWLKERERPGGEPA